MSWRGRCAPTCKQGPEFRQLGVLSTKTNPELNRLLNFKRRTAFRRGSFPSLRRDAGCSDSEGSGVGCLALPGSPVALTESGALPRRVLGPPGHGGFFALSRASGWCGVRRAGVPCLVRPHPPSASVPDTGPGHPLFDPSRPGHGTPTPYPRGGVYRGSQGRSAIRIKDPYTVGTPSRRARHSTRATDTLSPDEGWGRLYVPSPLRSSLSD